MNRVFLRYQGSEVGAGIETAPLVFATEPCQRILYLNAGNTSLVKRLSCSIWLGDANRTMK